jgi:hypothetical protein
MAASNVVLAECADTQIGRKYAADVDAGAAGATDTWIKGYMSSFQSWSYARDAFDKWSMQIANRFSGAAREQATSVDWTALAERARMPRQEPKAWPSCRQGVGQGRRFVAAKRRQLADGGDGGTPASSGLLIRIVFIAL